MALLGCGLVSRRDLMLTTARLGRLATPGTARCSTLCWTGRWPLLSRRLRLLDAGHIGGTPPRDLPGSVENCRDLSCSSDDMPGASAEVRSTPTQDPAYRPAHPLYRFGNPAEGTRFYPPSWNVGWRASGNLSQRNADGALVAAAVRARDYDLMLTTARLRCLAAPGTARWPAVAFDWAMRTNAGSVVGGG
jgi:hypothetical protein